jgi:hypothetical protein
LESIALHPAEAKSVTELCDLVLAAGQDRELLQQTIGTIALLVNMVTRQGKSDTLRAAFREIAHTCSVPDTRQIIKTAKVGLSTEQVAWLDQQLHAIAQGSETSSSPAV